MTFQPWEVINSIWEDDLKMFQCNQTIRNFLKHFHDILEKVREAPTRFLGLQIRNSNKN